MAFKPKVWLDRQSEYPDRRFLVPIDGLNSGRTYFVERSEGQIYQEGDVFEGSTMNDLESRIEAADKAQSSALTTAIQKEQSDRESAVSSLNTQLTGKISSAQEKADSAYSLADTKISEDGGEFSGDVRFKTRVYVYGGVRYMHPDGGIYTTIYTSYHGVNDNYFGVLGLRGPTNWTVRYEDDGADAPIYAANIAPPSSVRFKNIEGTTPDRDSDEIMDKLMAATVFDFEYKPESGFSDGVVYHGYKAEDIAKIDESFVYEMREENGEKSLGGIRWEQMVPHIIKHEKKQDERIAKLEAIVASLTGGK